MVGKNGAKRWLTERRKSSNRLRYYKDEKTNESADYKKYLRMDDSVFQHLLNKIRLWIDKRCSWCKKTDVLHL